MARKTQSSGQGGKIDSTAPQETAKAKPAKNARKPGPGRSTARTLRAAAAKLGFPVARIKAARDQGCPAFRDGGRIDLDELLVWLESHKPVEPETGETFNLELERAKDTRAARLLKEEKLKKNRGEVFSRDEVLAAWTSLVITFKNGLQDSGNEIAVESQMKLGLSPETANAIREIIGRHHRSWLKGITVGKGFCKPVCPQCKFEIKGDTVDSTWVDYKPPEEIKIDGAGI